MIELLKSKLDLNDYSIKPIKSSQIIFEQRVKINCFYCSKYNTNWSCPPRIPDLDYKKLISEYNNIIIVSLNSKINENNFNEIRNKSTNQLHSVLLMLEMHLWENNYPLAISFIGGSCKLCKDGCAKDSCKNKGLSRIPLEATGVNVVRSLSNVGIEVKFPISDNLTRHGMLLW